MQRGADEGREELTCRLGHCIGQRHFGNLRRSSRLWCRNSPIANSTCCLRRCQCRGRSCCASPGLGPSWAARPRGRLMSSRGSVISYSKITSMLVCDNSSRILFACWYWKCCLVFHHSSGRQVILCSSWLRTITYFQTVTSIAQLPSARWPARHAFCVDTALLVGGLQGLHRRETESPALSSAQPHSSVTPPISDNPHIMIYQGPRGNVRSV